MIRLYREKHADEPHRLHLCCDAYCYTDKEQRNDYAAVGLVPVPFDEAAARGQAYIERFLDETPEIGFNLGLSAEKVLLAALGEGLLEGL